ncbi:UNVERIFIED_CONTAM: hypothetical protein Scaly_2055900 [Sesamum calycinum]|uniref:Endonuclease/exonuclease/phosphatase domain-containing protein n=1 Tax=Sesamum calycinum TaxID=2727403 RepID=A0AAW2N490_9LAMI
MILLSWNCQGLGSPCTVHALGELLRTHKPPWSSWLKPSARKVGRSGGLALLWQKSLTVQLQSFGYHHIDATVYPGSEAEAWRFTGFYGIADTARRQDSWDLLSVLKQQSRRAWLIAGDFNEILCNSEKKGGRPRPNWQIRRFREALTSADVFDLGFEGDPFTWCNRHPEPETIYERLDRACADPLEVKFSEYSPSNLLVKQKECAARLVAWNTTRGSNSFRRQIRLKEKDLAKIRLDPSRLRFSRRTNDISRIKNGDGQWLTRRMISAVTLRITLAKFFGPGIHRKKNWRRD